MIRHMTVGCLVFCFYSGSCSAARDPFAASTNKKTAPTIKIKLIGIVLSQTDNCCSIAVLRVADQKKIVQVGDLVLNWRVSQITADKVVLTNLNNSLAFKELLVADLLV